ncbi:MAG: hypothetical protein OP8BY_1182 [Candidatus Saccharicenans subterraneus]|uniref:Uncharacterized protein n=1 Tax=Candidatus Saccharicenans subterraneus TaxID=2508984 RepID=A0A3E2BK04_9BACT|nr:MAG: hypothetical protein OP8BY_1182 [Candidatus Saccharicenans subterraneum]
MELGPEIPGDVRFPEGAGERFPFWLELKITGGVHEGL